MAKKTNCTINGKEYYRIYRKVGMKVNELGIWVDDRKAFYGSCKREAEEEYQKYMERKKAGTVTNKCLGQVIDQWVENVFKASDLSNSTKGHYIAAYENLLQKNDIAGQLPEAVTALDLQVFYNSCSAPAASVKALHYFLRHFYKYAELNGICRDITHSVTPPGKPKIDAQANFLTVDVWEDADLQKLVASMGNHRMRFLVILAVNTGCRIGELLAITYKDIKNGKLYITKQLSEAPRMDDSTEKLYEETVKTSASIRIIPLSNYVIAELDRHKAWQRTEMMKRGYRTEYLFTTSKGTWYRQRNVRKSLERFYRRIDVPHHKFHAFRATFGTNLCRAGVPIEETAKLMGHADISITAKYYVHVNADQKKQAVEKISTFSILE
ncbi:site-specific integrase [Anaerovorax odorimutans]|uniref:Site-specific integrase n=1 Tax=Anaerovorax odorimutans TaxID=109327 RepID=A0ABT1RT11_9FIRM|nr:site-specific integrase [Anaerovorax odorimutans]MCQ4638006.1 site-specific integrase [Anaerovorax odorimutans]